MLPPYRRRNIKELCVELGQTHPKGVLWYSVTELVVLFCSADEMLVTMHGVIKSMALYEEPIWLHMSPPLTVHVRDYAAVRDGYPSGINSPTPDREEVPQPSPSNSQLDGGPHASIRWDLRDFGDAQLRQLMEDLHQEVALREFNVPPGTHCQTPGEIQ